MRSPVGTVGLPPVTTILLIRHGDRHDYAIGKEPWKLRCKASDTLVLSDPPLSALGHSQARSLASYLVGSTGRRVDRILCSPYLRALQTAQPLAHASGLPLLVDFVAAEAHQMPSALPPIDARLPYVPEIDEGHVPHMRSVVTDGARGKEPGVEPRLEHMRRMLLLASLLRTDPECVGKCVAVVTHAASVALVAALACTPSLEAAGKLAPCGLCELSLPSDGGPATVVSRGDDGSAYLPGAAAGATAAWGFADSAEPLESAERMWQEALLLGPTDLAALGPQPDPTDPQAGGRGAAQWAKVDEAYEPESCVQGL